MQKITPFLWFEKEADRIVQFYTSVFGGESKIKNKVTLTNTPSGTVDVVSVELLGHQFTMMTAGPLFKFTPAISFIVACSTTDEVNALWDKLSDGGAALMPLDKYPFSERYGWIQDKYGLSWQLIFLGQHQAKQRIIPSLLFVGEKAGKAEEAMGLYTSVFRNSKMGDIARYGKGQEPDKEGTVMYGEFTLEGQQFAAMDSAREHNFSFNEAVSLEVACDTQEEIDYYWGKLSAVPASEQCGWLKDKYGVSWQIVPKILNEMLQDKDRARVSRVTQAFLQMKKFDIAALKRAYAS